MRRLYVCDTNAIIYFFSNVFSQPNKLSRKANALMSAAIWSKETEVRLCIPSIVFVEIFEKWLTSEEFLRKFFFEVFVPLRDSENVEVRGIDRDTIECLLTIGGGLANHEMHDKLVLAAAMALNCELITSDPAIKKHVETTGAIPAAFD